MNAIILAVMIQFAWDAPTCEPGQESKCDIDGYYLEWKQTSGGWDNDTVSGETVDAGDVLNYTTDIDDTLDTYVVVRSYKNKMDGTKKVSEVSNEVEILGKPQVPLNLVIVE